MHEAALKHFGLEGSYQLFDVPPDELPSYLSRLNAAGFTGYNVTIPHKERILRFLDRLSPEAQIAGAVNTVKIESDGKSQGYNTDTHGFATAITALVDGEVTPASHAVIVGSGGSARAVMYALSANGWRRVTIVSRNTAAAVVMSGAFNTGKFSTAGLTTGATTAASTPRTRTLPCTDTFEELSGSTLVVNCTPIGLAGSDDPEAGSVPEWYPRLFQKCGSGTAFFDLIYGDGGLTPLVRLAQNTGLTRVCDGSAMLVGQAAKAFEIWTGKMPPLEVMARALGVTN